MNKTVNVENPIVFTATVMTVQNIRKEYLNYQKEYDQREMIVSYINTNTLLKKDDRDECKEKLKG